MLCILVCMVCALAIFNEFENRRIKKKLLLLSNEIEKIDSVVDDLLDRTQEPRPQQYYSATAEL